MYVDNLVLETTRRCNMQCEHCLRGESQRLSMNREILYDFFSQVEYIGTITFSGGEPSLPSGIKVMEDVLQICGMKGVEVSNFYIATNGKYFRKNFCETVMKWYYFCDDNEISSVDVSNDQYHEENSSVFYQMEEWFLYNHGYEDIVHQRMERGRDMPSVIAQGRASNWGDKKQSPTTFMVTGESITEGAIYLNCKGNIIRGCDFSYKSQDTPENILCKAKDFSSFITNKLNTVEEFGEEGIEI